MGGVTYSPEPANALFRERLTEDQVQGIRSLRRVRRLDTSNLWLDADPPTWKFPDETPPHILAGLRRLFNRAEQFKDRAAKFTHDYGRTP